MARTRRKAKLLADLVGAKSAPSAGGPGQVSLTDHDSCQGPIAASAILIAASNPATETNRQQVLFAKGAATALAFKPVHWSYEATTESEDSRLSLAPVSTKEAGAEPAPVSARSQGKTTKASVSAKEAESEPAPSSARPPGETTDASVSTKEAEAEPAPPSARPAGETTSALVSSKETETKPVPSSTRPAGETTSASVSTKEVEVESAPSSAQPAGEAANAAVPIPAAGHVRTAEDRTAQQALTADLAEMIDSVLRTHQFATRGIHESFRKRPTTRVLSVEQFATSQDIVSALRAELARAKADPEAEARVTRPVLDLVLGFIGLGESTVDVAGSTAVRDQPNVR